MSNRRIGLARVLSKLGYCSRSQAFTLIRAGKVAVNGRVIRQPESPVDERNDRISVEGKSIVATGKIYLMLNKPRGVVTTTSDEKGRDTVYSLLPRGLPWLAPVGRLDKASEGLLLLTNDSEWAARITAPNSHVPKTYHVQIGAVADDDLLRALGSGVQSEDEVLRVKRASILRLGGKNSWLQIVLDEGRNRQIRRIFEGLGVEVLRLVRVAIGPIELGDLAKSQSRELTVAEKDALDALFPPVDTSVRK
ncbi:MAG TPA: pseudouridine synthase [Terriglobales bacterium]|nr:pseudouridine synthase [Terriglobales bacterium]